MNWHCDPPRDTSDEYTDIAFSAIYLIDFIVVLIFSVRSFRRSEKMATLANILIIAFLLACLLNRLLCLLASLLINCNKDVNRNTVSMWFYFELPIAFINAASIVIFFEWTQFASFIKATQPKQIPDRKSE
jgi:hypothetical membrane protein